MAKHKSQSQLLAPGRLRLPVIFAVMALVVVAGYLLVKFSHAASGVMSVRNGSTSSTVGLGNNFTVSVYANGGTEALNAIQADVTYPAGTFQFVSCDNTGSAYPLEAAGACASTTSGNGALSFTRAISPGTTPISGDGLVLNLTFKATALGSGTIGLSNTSLGLSAATSSNVIVAYNGLGLTVADTVAPSVPTGLTQTASSVSTVAFTWATATDNVGVTGYKVYRNGTQIGTTGTAAFSDTGLMPSTSNNYTVAAYDAAGNTSGQSAALTGTTKPDTTAPTAPTTVTATNRTLTSITLSWTASTDNVGVVGYHIAATGRTAGLTATTTSYADTGLTPGTSYTYVLTAYDAAGNTSASSTAYTVSTLPDTIAPSTPTGLTLVSQSSGKVALSWTVASDNVAVTSYNVYQSGIKVGTSTTNSGSFALATTPGTYSFTVAAVDAAGNVSAQSTGVSAKVYGASDVNHDGTVNVIDLSLLLSNWGKPGVADINGDGTTNVIDLSLLLAAWTKVN